MRKQFLPFLLLILGLPLLAGCGLLPAAPGTGKPVPITGDDNGKTFDIGIGQQAVIALAGNATTGYAWEAAPPSAASVMPVGEPQYQPDAHPPGKVGVGGTYTFTYQGASPGAAKLSFAYRRSWEKDAPPAQTFVVTLNVK